jgi:hypothetical protein
MPVRSSSLPSRSTQTISDRPALSTPPRYANRLPFVETEKNPMYGKVIFNTGPAIRLGSPDRRPAFGSNGWAIRFSSWKNRRWPSAYAALVRPGSSSVSSVESRSPR